MLATNAFDVCLDVYQAAREVIDTKIATLSLESAGKYLWHPDRMPRLSEYVADFARAGERALTADRLKEKGRCGMRIASCAGAPVANGGVGWGARQAEVSATRASRMAMFRVYYLGGAEYQAARRHLGISEVTWGDWAEEIRGNVGRELKRSGVFPPGKYFREMTKAS